MVGCIGSTIPSVCLQKVLSLSKFDNEQSLKINMEGKYLSMFSDVFAKKHDQWKTSFTKYYT
jgi:hypothetical protein